MSYSGEHLEGTEQDLGDRVSRHPSRDPAPIPWRRVIGLLRPLRRGVVAMVGLTVSGVLIGLVPPLALGVLINALVEHNDKTEAAILAGLVALAVLLEAGAYVASDGMYARNASRLYRNLRLQMFAGARRGHAGAERRTGVASRFISDAETLELITLSILDRGAMQVVEFVSAMVALAILDPWTIVVVLPSLAGTWLVARHFQRPMAIAGQRRQEELEAMTSTISKQLACGDDDRATRRFHHAAERVMAAEVRLGWLRAVNLQGSGGLAKLGPLTAVVATAFMGLHKAGTLMAVYLLAQRAFWGFDGLVDLRLDTQGVRGAVARCFELIDATANGAQSPAGGVSRLAARQAPDRVRCEATGT
jgi:ABC-type multidrug transport system fused ATPase/permease subunit